MLRIRVLRFIENNAIGFFANAPGYIRKPHQFSGERDLIGVRHQTAFESKLAVIALHFGSDAKRTRVHPVAQRSKRFAPDANKLFRSCCAGRPRNELVRFAPSFFPALQFRFRLRDIQRWLFVGGINFSKACVRTLSFRFGSAKIDFCVARQLH